MNASSPPPKVWTPGTAPVAVIMISLNEGHNMEAVLDTLEGWAEQVFLVDSCSMDDTVDIALRRGVHVVQRRFRGFGNQWNFALAQLPITAPWTMKLDPDERITDELKQELLALMQPASGASSAYEIPIRLTFMRRRLSNVLHLVRLWKTGSVRFSEVPANEHALCDAPAGRTRGEILHLDSPDLDHWVSKQNAYTTAEAAHQFARGALTTRARLLGTALERRMWLKKNFWRIPGRYLILFWYHFLVLGGWRAGRIGWIWAHLRTSVYRMWEFKKFEIDRMGGVPAKRPSGVGSPDARVRLYE